MIDPPNARLTKYGSITNATTFPAAFCWNVPGGDYKNLHLSIGLIHDTLIALNSVFGVRVYLYIGQSLGLADGWTTQTDRKGKQPDFVLQSNMQLFQFFEGPLNILVEFYPNPATVLTGNVSIELTLNVW